MQTTSPPRPDNHISLHKLSRFLEKSLYLRSGVELTFRPESTEIAITEVAFDTGTVSLEAREGVDKAGRSEDSLCPDKSKPPCTRSSPRERCMSRAVVMARKYSPASSTSSLQSSLKPSITILGASLPRPCNSIAARTPSVKLVFLVTAWKAFTLKKRDIRRMEGT